jgi:hypothetical protein
VSAAPHDACARALMGMNRRSRFATHSRPFCRGPCYCNALAVCGSHVPTVAHPCCHGPLSPSVCRYYRRQQRSAGCFFRHLRLTRVQAGGRGSEAEPCHLVGGAGVCVRGGRRPGMPNLPGVLILCSASSVTGRLNAWDRAIALPSTHTIPPVCSAAPQTLSRGGRASLMTLQLSPRWAGCCD